MEVLHTDLLARQEHTATRFWLGRAHKSQEHFEEARIYFERALALGHDDHVTSNEVLAELAMMDVSESANHFAREKFEHLLRMTQQVGDHPAEVGISSSLAAIDVRQGSVQPGTRETRTRADHCTTTR